MFRRARCARRSCTGRGAADPTSSPTASSCSPVRRRSVASSSVASAYVGTASSAATSFDFRLVPQLALHQQAREIEPHRGKIGIEFASASRYAAIAPSTSPSRARDVARPAQHVRASRRERARRRERLERRGRIAGFEPACRREHERIHVARRRGEHALGSLARFRAAPEQQQRLRFAALGAQHAADSRSAPHDISRARHRMRPAGRECRRAARSPPPHQHLAK